MLEMDALFFFVLLQTCGFVLAFRFGRSFAALISSAGSRITTAELRQG